MGLGACACFLPGLRQERMISWMEGQPPDCTSHGQQAVSLAPDRVHKYHYYGKSVNEIYSLRVPSSGRVCETQAFGDGISTCECFVSPSHMDSDFDPHELETGTCRIIQSSLHPHTVVFLS